MVLAMKKNTSLYYYLLIFFFSHSVSFAQNLIPNPSFETITACPNNVTLTANATPWINMNGHGGSADLFSTCATSTLVTVPVSYFGNQTAATGNNYVGLCLQYQGGLANFREYIQVQFTSPLIAGQCYTLSFKYSLADNFTLATDKLGVYLSNTSYTAGGGMNNVPLTPTLQNPAGNFLNNKTAWVTLSFAYTAAGGEQFMVLGNFLNDAATPVINTGSGTIVGSYIFVDDFSMVQVACTSVNPTFPDHTICPGQSVTFNHIDANPGATWTTLANPGVPVGTGVPFTVSPTTTTTYVYSFGGFTDTATVTVLPNPSITLSNNQTICNGQSTTLTASASPASTFLWSTGATGNSISVSTAGTYTVTATSVTGGCTSNASVNVSVESVTVAINPVNTTICNGQTVSLTATPSMASNLLWSTGSTNATISVGTAGTYTVTATTANGCTANANSIVNVQAAPVLTITNDTTICSGQTINLTVNSNIPATLLWNTGSTNNTINVSNAGNYSVVATSTPDGCVSTTDVDVLVENISVSINPANTSICNGQVAQLTATASGPSSLLWSTGANGANLAVTNAGTYTVTATSPNGCTSSSSADVVVNPSPILTLSNDTILCTGQSVQLFAATDIPSDFLWDNGSTSNSITTSLPGTYSVTASSQVGGCTATDFVNVGIENLTISLSPANASLCNGQNVTLSASTNIPAVFNWSTGSTNSSINVGTAGTYTVDAITANGCTASMTGNVNVAPIPVLTLTNDTTICGGSAITLLANTDIPSSFSWNNGSTNNTINTSTAGTYIVTATGNGSSCSVTDTVILQVENITVVISPNVATICPGLPAQLTASVNMPASYNWNTGSNAQTIQATTPGNYSITVTSVAGCVASADAVINDGTLHLNLGPDSTICMTQELYIGANVSGANQYSWNTGNTGSVFLIQNSGTYILTASNSNTGCSVSDTVSIVVEDCSYPYFIPNSFTPNGDGRNDVFSIVTDMPEGAEFNFYIFNRWGELIFHAENNFNFGWDGTHKGQKSPVDVYVWKLVLFNPITNDFSIKTGHVSLIR